MRTLPSCVLMLFLLAGCGTTKTYTPKLAAGPPKPADYPIPVYHLNMRIPRPCELIGELYIGDTQLTVHGGTLPGVMRTVITTAREKGADVVELTSIKPPDFESAHFRVQAKLLRYSDTWETVNCSEKDFVAYLQQHQQTLDPIEGIWFDGSRDRIGIMRNSSKPGRNFVAFLLNAVVPSWSVGCKKMDIALTDRPGAYRINYYRDDFSMAKTSVLLEHETAFSFMINLEDKTELMSFIKIGTPRPLN